MPRNQFWTDRGEFDDTLSAVARVLGFAAPNAHDLERELDGTWWQGGPWLPVFEDAKRNTRVSLAIDECWGVVYDIECPKRDFSQVVIVMTAFNAEHGKVNFCSQCGHRFAHSVDQCPLCGGLSVTSQLAARHAILAKLRSGCTESEFASMRCPICGTALRINVHPNGHTFSIRCGAPPICLIGQDTCANPPQWFRKHFGGSWFSS